MARTTRSFVKKDINGLMSVAYAAVTGGINLLIGQLYDRAGSTWTWAVILGVTLLSAATAVALKALDKKAYPKLYRVGERQEEQRSSSIP